MTKAYLMGFICGYMKLDQKQNNPWANNSWLNYEQENEEFDKGYWEALNSRDGLTDIMELAK